MVGSPILTCNDDVGIITLFLRTWRSHGDHTNCWGQAVWDSTPRNVRTSRLLAPCDACERASAMLVVMGLGKSTAHQYTEKTYCLWFQLCCFHRFERTYLGMMILQFNHRFRGWNYQPVKSYPTTNRQLLPTRHETRIMNQLYYIQPSAQRQSAIGRLSPHPPFINHYHHYHSHEP